MNDFFQLLNQPRRPWLDGEALKEEFYRRSAETHPDRVHSASPEEKAAANRHSTELNAAFQCLSNGRQRLKHLLELETGGRSSGVQEIPADTTELFLELGRFHRELDSFLAEKRKVSSPMLKVQFFEKGMEWSERLSRFQEEIAGKRQRIEEELKALNSHWENAPPTGSSARADSLPLNRLEELYRALSFLDRWGGQIQERLFELGQ